MATGLPSHDGAPRPADDVLLGDPGPTIGTLLSVTTEVDAKGRKRAGDEGRLLRGRILLTLFGGMAGAAVAGFFLGERTVGQIAGPLIGMLLVQLFYRRRPAVTTYVGTEGIARFTAQAGETLRWDDAARLLAARSRRVVRGTYVGTIFRYTWLGETGKSLFEIQAVYHDGTGKPGGLPPAQPINALHFAEAAERSYVAPRLRRAKEALANGHDVHFKVSPREGICVRPQGLRIKPHLAKEIDVPRNALEGFETSDGLVSFRVAGRSDALRFRVAEVPDLQVLHSLVEALLEPPPPGPAWEPDGEPTGDLDSTSARR